MFESLIDSREGRPASRWPAGVALAIGLHLAVLAGLLLHDLLSVPAIGAPLLEVTFAQFALPAAPPPPAGSGPAGESPPPAEAELAAPVPADPAEVVQPQTVPETVALDPEPEAPAAPVESGAGDGVSGSDAGGAPGGMAGGVPGGVTDGVPGGLAGGVPGGALPDGPVWAGGDVTAPEVLHRELPDYPPLARQARIEGEVKLEAVIRRDGSIGDVRVVQGLGLGCTQAAIAALKRWRFRPGECRGVPVDVYFALTVEFTVN